MEAVFEWDGQYSVDCPLLDEQHEELIQLAAELHRRYDAQERGTLAEAFGYMNAYTKYHLRLEEVVMERVDYPQLTEHVEEHRRFEEAIGLLQARFEAGDESAADAAAGLLSDWLLKHIREVDRHLVDYLKQSYPAEELKALMERSYSEVSLYTH